MLEANLVKIKKQFLCQTPIAEIAWNGLLDNIKEEDVTPLLKNTINYEGNLKYPVKIEYQKVFIKHVINALQRRNIEIKDDVYDALGRLLNLVQNGYCYKHYNAEDKQIVLKENLNIISNGTTGLCSWQASIALAEWILNNKLQFEGKTVLELGSGVGLTGLVISLCCLSKEVFLSDCHVLVLNNLCTNINLNVPSRIDTTNSEFLQINISGDTKIIALNLPWEDVDNKKADLIKPNVIVAADIIYDKDLFVPLLNALECFAKNGNVEIVLACTERNEETLTMFLNAATNRNFSIHNIQTPEQNNFVWSKTIPIKLYLLKR